RGPPRGIGPSGGVAAALREAERVRAQHADGRQLELGVAAAGSSKADGLAEGNRSNVATRELRVHDL
ncbi:MAG: hypothetical protein ACREM1_25475, partial [Longimicrobiales bacterium]